MKSLIRGEISILAETPKELADALRVIAAHVEGSCNLDEPEGEQRYTGDDDESIISAVFKVLPQYREGDLEKFIGCAPNATGDLSTEEFISKIRGEG